MDARDVLEDVRDTGDDTVVIDTHVVVYVVAVIVLVGGRAAGRRMGRWAGRQTSRRKFFITTTETSQNSSKWSLLITHHDECIDLCIRSL